MGVVSIMGVNAIRFAKLTTTGAPDFNNPLGGFTLCGGISTFEHDFETEDGADIFEEDAAGNACVVRKKPDRIKRVTFTLTLCRSDYRINEVLGVGTAVTQGQNVVGQAVRTSAGCGTPVVNNGVSIELWSEQWDCDVAAAVTYQRAIIPRAYLTPSGFTRENGVAMPVFTGFGVSSSTWGDGPFGDADVLSSTTGWCYAEVDDAALPYCPSPVGYVNIPGSAS